MGMWEQEPGVHVIRMDQIAGTLAIHDAVVEAMMETLDEKEAPVVKVNFDAGRMKFNLFAPLTESVVVRALQQMGRTFIKVEVLGAKKEKEPWLLEKEELLTEEVENGEALEGAA